MLTPFYIGAFCLAWIGLCAWSLTAGKTAIGRMAPWLFVIGMLGYLTLLLLLPKLFMIKLFLLFRDLGLLGLSSMAVFLCRDNKILALGMIILIAMAVFYWYLPLMVLSV